MDLKLTGKKALISGSTAGIGYAIAERFLAEGASVIINGRSEESVNAAITNLKSTYPNGEILGVAADFSKVEDVNRLLSEVAEVDILINNAGIFEPKSFVDIPDEDWFRLFEINVMSGIRLSRFLLPKNACQKLGENYLHFKRIRCIYTGGNDPLWNDQNCTIGCKSRLG